MTLEMIVATLWQPEWCRCVRSWADTALTDPLVRFFPGQELIRAYHRGFLRSPADVLGYVHDDVLIYDRSWDSRVLRQFFDPQVTIVGFAGALGHGHPNLYKGPYHLPHLARQSFMSNMRDAEKHGTRFTGERDVAVLDGFACFYRRSFLEEVGGWTGHGPIGYFLYTEFMCCMARRLGYKIRLVGVDCEHLGGKSSGLKPDQVFDYEGEHAWLYKEFRDVLPARIP